jgi:hypothetical protein
MHGGEQFADVEYVDVREHAGVFLHGPPHDHPTEGVLGDIEDGAATEPQHVRKFRAIEDAKSAPQCRIMGELSVVDHLQQTEFWRNGVFRDCAGRLQGAVNTQCVSWLARGHRLGVDDIRWIREESRAHVIGEQNDSDVEKVGVDGVVNRGAGVCDLA